MTYLHFITGFMLVLWVGVLRNGLLFNGFKPRMSAHSPKLFQCIEKDSCFKMVRWVNYMLCLAALLVMFFGTVFALVIFDTMIRTNNVLWYPLTFGVVSGILLVPFLVRFELTHFAIFLCFSKVKSDPSLRDYLVNGRKYK